MSNDKDLQTLAGLLMGSAAPSPGPSLSDLASYIPPVPRNRLARLANVDFPPHSNALWSFATLTGGAPTRGLLPPPSPDARWVGPSGDVVEFYAYSPESVWMPRPAIYVYANRVDGLMGAWWNILRVGQTHDLDDRSSGGHEEWPRAQRHGATHVLVSYRSDYETEESRKALEAQMIAAFDPPLNRQHPNPLQFGM